MDTGCGRKGCKLRRFVPMECGPNLRKPLFKGKADGREKRALTQKVQRYIPRARTQPYTRVSLYMPIHKPTRAHTRAHS